jgi:GNAT superfamily N-acetyltransferase
MISAARRSVERVGHLVCESLGRIEVTDTLSRELLTPLLLELREEPCPHSWQPVLAKLPPDDAFDAFERIVANGRPGRVFTYYRETEDGCEPLALGVVSDAVTKGFPFEGIPVVGRAFVRPAYRRQLLYPAILAHRLEYCRTRWTGGLLAIHLGTASASIERSFRRLHHGRVVCLGDEDLGEAGHVRALLGITSGLDRGLRRGVPDSLRDEQAAVMEFFHTGACWTRVADVAPALAALAEHHAGFFAIDCFRRALPALR